MRIIRAAGLSFLLCACASGQVEIASIPIGNFPFDIAVNPDTNYVYVTQIGPPASVAVVNASTNTLEATILLESSPRGIGVNRTTNQIFVTSADPPVLVVIDGASQTVAATYPIPGAPLHVEDVEANRFTNRVYFGTSSGVHVFAPATGTFEALIPVAALGIAVDEINNRIYGAAGYIVEIDGSTASVIRVIPSAADLRAVDVNPYTNRIISCDGSNGYCPYYNSVTGELVGTLETGGTLQGVSINKTLNRIYFGINLVVADGGSLTQVAELGSGYARLDFGIDENTNRIYGYRTEGYERAGTLVVYQEIRDIVPAGLTSAPALSTPCAGPGGSPNCPEYRVALSATVSNPGAWVTVSQAVRFEYSADGGGTFTPISGTVPVGALAPGATAVATKEWRNVAPGSYQIRVTVDANNSNVEWNESNNTAVYSITVP